MSVIQQALIFGNEGIGGQEIWAASLYDMHGAINTNESSGRFAFIESTNEVVSITYKDVGIDYIRFDASNFSVTGVIPALTDNWDWDTYNLIYDPQENVLWTTVEWLDALGRINVADWSITYTVITPIDIPAPLLPFYGGQTQCLTAGYYIFVRNPINGDMYVGDQSSYTIFHKINKTTSQPQQSYFLAGANVVKVSPYVGYADSTLAHIYYGPIAFVSATEAYIRDYNVPDIFHLNLTTGIATFVFRLVMDPEGRSCDTHPIYYDSATNTLWLLSYNHSKYEPWQVNPRYGIPSLWSWIVGSEPSTMIEYQIPYDLEMRIGVGPGNQIQYTRDIDWNVDYFNNGVWIRFHYYTSGPYDESNAAWNRMFSFQTRTFTKFGVDTTDPMVVMNSYPGSMSYWHDPIMTSSTVGWFVGEFDDYPNEVATKIYKAKNRTPVTGRYVRISLIAPVRGTTAAGLQEISIRSTEGGANVAISVTATSENVLYPASNLLNADLVNYANGWVAANTSYPQVIVADLGSSLPIYEIALWPLNKATTTLENCSPRTIVIEISTDNINWGEITKYQGLMAWRQGINIAVDPALPRTFLVLPVTPA